jgi:outer membrane protease
MNRNNTVREVTGEVLEMGVRFPKGVGILFPLIWVGLECSHLLEQWARNALFRGLKWSELETDSPHYNECSFKHVVMLSSSFPIT